MNNIPITPPVNIIKPIKGDMQRNVNLSKDEQNLYPGSRGINQEDLVTATDNANKKIKDLKLNVELSYYKDTNQLIIKFVDSETKEIVKEYPPEKYLDMIQSLIDLAGLVVNKKV